MKAAVFLSLSTVLFLTVIQCAPMLPQRTGLDALVGEAPGQNFDSSPKRKHNDNEVVTLDNLFRMKSKSRSSRDSQSGLIQKKIRVIEFEKPHDENTPEELSEEELAAIDILNSRFHSANDMSEDGLLRQVSSFTEEVPDESVSSTQKRQKSSDTTSQGDIKVLRKPRSQLDVRMVNKAWGHSTDLLSNSDKLTLSDTTPSPPLASNSRIE